MVIVVHLLSYLLSRYSLKPETDKSDRQQSLKVYAT